MPSDIAVAVTSVSRWSPSAARKVVEAPDLLVEARVRHKGAFSLLAGGKPLLLHAPERLADRPHADAKSARQIALVWKRRAGPPFPVCNPLDQRIAYLEIKWTRRKTAPDHDRTH